MIPSPAKNRTPSHRRKMPFDFDLRNHGIPVKRGCLFSMVAGRDPVSGKEKIYLGIAQAHVRTILVEIDTDSGQCSQHFAEEDCVCPWGMTATPEGKVLVTGVEGTISLFDPVAKTFRKVAKTKTWFWCIVRGCDGKYYLGGYPEAKLFRFDLNSCKLEEIATLDPTQKYVRFIAAGEDGYIYGAIGCTVAQVIAYEIASGKFKKALPHTEEVVATPTVGRGLDGSVYVRCTTGSIYLLKNGRAVPIPKDEWKGFAPITLQNGDPVKYVDPDRIQIGIDQKAKVFPIEYEGDGTTIFHLAEGPGKAVYGSTLLPLYISRYTPTTDSLECLGRGGRDNGEAYSIGHAGGKLYYATYPSGSLLCFDPSLPWESTPNWDSNPRTIAKLGEGHCRPRAMAVDVLQRVWVGSYPEYGRYHGGLAFYDTVNSRVENNPVVIPDQSIVALACDPSVAVIYGATTTTRGSGTDPVTAEAQVFAWDVAAREVLWSIVPVAGESSINNLIYRDGKLYGTTHPQTTFFVLDVASRMIVRVVKSKFGGAREQSMSLATDGNIYGITWMSLFRWSPDGAVEELIRCKGKDAKPYGGSLFHRGAAIIDGRFFFSSGASVMSIRLPSRSNFCR